MFPSNLVENPTTYQDFICKRIRICKQKEFILHNNFESVDGIWKNVITALSFINFLHRFACVTLTKTDPIDNFLIQQKKNISKSILNFQKYYDIYCFFGLLPSAKASSER